MVIAIKCIRVLILIVSFYGYMQFLRKKVKLEFTIGIMFSSIGSILFLAGILNIMKETAFLICLCGLVFAVLSIHNRESIGRVVSVGTIFFGILNICLFLLLYRSKFVAYDDFSHWAIVMKVLLGKNRFPNFTDVNIMFQSYPLGSSSFIYYICKITGIHSEWMQMCAQAMLMNGILISLFAFARKWQSQILLILCHLILLAGNTNLLALLVDTLLPIIGVGGMAFCIYYKKYLQEKIWWIIPYTVFLVSVKNSGIFFVIVILIYSVIFIPKDRNSLRKWIYSALSPLVVLALWQKHVKLVFDDGLMAKHSMTLSNFESVFGEKDLDSILSIIGKIIGRTFTFTNPILIILVFLLVLWFFEKQFYGKLVHKSIFKDMSYIIFLSYIAYQVSQIGMYLFTMPLSEALDLASYSRYHATILLFIAGILLIGVVQISNSFKNNSQKNYLVTGVSVLCLLCVWFSINPRMDFYKKQKLEGASRQKYDTIINKYNIPTGKKYLLIKEKVDDQGYLFFMTKYLLDPMDWSVTSIDLLENQDVLTYYDYVIVWDDTEQIRQYIEENSSQESNAQIIWGI